MVGLALLCSELPHALVAPLLLWHHNPMTPKKLFRSVNTSMSWDQGTDTAPTLWVCKGRGLLYAVSDYGMASWERLAQKER